MTTQPSSPATTDERLTIRKIEESVHLDFLAGRRSVSFLQNPSWGDVKSEWRSQSIGWFRGGRLVAVSLVLHRHVPVPLLKRRSLAYIADGPIIDRSQTTLRAVLEPLVPFLRAEGAFLIRMGLPVVHRRWEAATVRRALAAGDGRLIPELEPATIEGDARADIDTLSAMGWGRPELQEDFPAGQPQFQARIPLPRLGEDEREEESEGFQSAVEKVLSRMDATSRRQTRKSTRSELTVTRGGYEELAAWHALYEQTAERDEFAGRSLGYFEKMYKELAGSRLSNCHVLLAHYEEELLAAAIYVQQADFGWYVYGASSRQEGKRYAPRLLQLEQIKLSLLAGAEWFDLGGVSPTLDPSHQLAGLTRFKTTMGADVVETVGEWDFEVNPLLAKAFNLYLARR